jgi:4a-hydroxytetrahydrobiopterin dehydratase
LAASVVKEPLLTDDDVRAALLETGNPTWDLIGGQLVRVIVFDGFKEALEFVNGVGELAEDRNHHPDIDIRYNRVTLALVTHDSGGITQLDIDLARAIDNIAPEGRPPG